VPKTYDQYCPIAHALDLVGDRWSLLIVRELSSGPRRYTDLLEGLGGCSTNMLAARLRDLEDGAVVARRRLAPPASANVYELTEAGHGLKSVLRSLAQWGARTLGPPPEGAVLPPGWLLRALETAVAPVAPGGRFQFACGEERAALIDARAMAGDTHDADASLEADVRAMHRFLVDGDLSGLRVTGSRAAARRLAGAVAGSRG
jgi:DNA-binding HxlR family transcriptional regulator